MTIEVWFTANTTDRFVALRFHDCDLVLSQSQFSTISHTRHWLELEEHHVLNCRDVLNVNVTVDFLNIALETNVELPTWIGSTAPDFTLRDLYLVIRFLQIDCVGLCAAKDRIKQMYKRWFKGLFGGFHFDLSARVSESMRFKTEFFAWSALGEDFYNSNDSDSQHFAQTIFELFYWRLIKKWVKQVQLFNIYNHNKPSLEMGSALQTKQFKRQLCSEPKLLLYSIFVGREKKGLPTLHLRK